MRARGVPLVPSAVRGAPASSWVTPGTLGEGLVAGGRNAVGPAPQRAPRGSLGRSLKATSGQKVCTGACTKGGQRRAGAVPRAFRTRFCSLFPSRSFSLSVWSWKGGHYKWSPPPRVPDGPLPGPQVERLPTAPGTHGVRRFESSPRSSLRPPETLEQPSNTGVSLDTRTRLSPRSPPMGTFEPPKLVHHFGYR